MKASGVLAGGSRMPTYEFDVLVHGKSVTKYVHEGLVYIEGRSGSEFTLLVRNNSSDRILAVMTVDGLSIMDGKKGSLDGNGYVVNPWQTLKIPGWRLDDDDVAKFVFGSIGKSYAAKKGAKRDVGVIGCAIFEEDRPAHTIDLSRTRVPRVRLTDLGTSTKGSSGSGPLRSHHTITECSDESYTSGGMATSSVYSANSIHDGDACMDWCPVTSSDATPGTYRPESARKSKKSSGGVPVQNIGTEFGKRTAHAVTEVTFNRKDRPAEVFSVHYDDKHGLEQRGIDLKRNIQVARPFPKDAEAGCEPPAGWRG